MRDASERPMLQCDNLPVMDGDRWSETACARASIRRGMTAGIEMACAA